MENCHCEYSAPRRKLFGIDETFGRNSSSDGAARRAFGNGADGNDAENRELEGIKNMENGNIPKGRRCRVGFRTFERVRDEMEKILQTFSTNTSPIFPLLAPCKGV